MKPTSRWKGTLHTKQYRPEQLNAKWLLLFFFIIARPNLAQPAISAKPELVLQTGHASDVQSVVFSPNGHLLASGGFDGKIILWDVETGRTLRALIGKCAIGLAFSPDERLLVSGCGGTAELWDVQTGRMVRRIDGQAALFASFVFSSDGRRLTSAGWEGASLWDVATGEELRSLMRFHRTSADVALGADVVLSGNGEWLAVGRSSNFGKNETEIWNVATGQKTHAMAETNAAQSFAFSPDGRSLASLNFNGRVTLWEVATGHAAQTFDIFDANNRGDLFRWWGLAFSPNGKWLVTSHDKDVRLWEVPTGRSIRALLSTEGAGAVAFSSNGRLLAAAGHHSITIVDVENSNAPRILEGRVDKLPAVAFSPDGHFLASVSDDYSIKIWDVLAGREAHFLRGQNTKADVFTLFESIVCLAFSPDGRTLASGGSDSTVRVWEFPSGRELYTLKGISGASGAVKAVAFSPDGRSIAASAEIPMGSSTGGQLTIWDALTGRQLFSMFDDHPPRTLAFSANGKLLASGSVTSLELWDARTGSKQQLEASPQSNDALRNIMDVSYREKFNLFTRLAFSPDGHWLASGGLPGVSPGAIKLWEVATGREANALAGHVEAVTDLSFSPDGRLLASASKDGTVKLWVVATGREMGTLSGHTDEVSNIVFSPDGQRLATSSKDRTLKLWTVSTGKELGTLSGHSDEILGIVFNPDGRQLASTSNDGSIRVWDGVSGEPLVLLSPMHANRDWIAVTPDGLFDGSPAGMQELVAWRIGNRMYPPDRFFADYYTPGLLAEIFAGRHPKPKIDLAALKLPPDLRITTPSSGAALREPHVAVVVEAQDQGGGIAEVRLYQNGKLVATRSGEARAMQKQTFDVNLVIGENNLKAVALSKDRVESNDDSVRVVLEAPELKKPVLRLLVVGINQYEDPKFDLDFAQPDAEAIARFFDLGNRLFSSIDAIKLFSGDATKAHIERALGGFAERAQPEDVLLVYLAGRGVGLGEQFYFLPHEMRTEMDEEAAIRKYGIPASVLGDALLRVKSLKQVLILDTCESGNALPLLAKAVMFKTRGLGAEEEKAVKMLARSEGVYLIAASTKQQYAYEVPELGHGVLAYALLSGLGEKGLPKAPTSTEGIVTVFSLLQYVNQQVPELTDKYHRGEKQYPVSSNTGQDFPLWVH